MAKKKVGGKNNKRDDTASEKDKKKKNSEPSLAEDEVTKTTRRYSTRRGGSVDEKAKGETSGAKKTGENAPKGKRKLEVMHPEMVQTPSKKRKAGKKEAEAIVSSHEKSSYSFREKRAIPRFRKVDLSQSEFRGAVGKRVRVAEDPNKPKKLRTGRIKSYSLRKKQHTVVYDDDGKSGTLDMETDQFELEIKPGEAEVYKFKEGSSAGKGKSVAIEDDEKKENLSKLKKEDASSGSTGRFTRAQKGKDIATQTNKAKERDSGPVLKGIKICEPVNDAEERSSKSQKGPANDVKTAHVASHKTVSNAGSNTKTVSRKTKKAGDKAHVESRKNPVRKGRR